MKYPVWFPVPQAWLRALILFLSLIPCVLLWRTFAPILEIPERLAARRSPVALELAWDIFFWWLLILGILAPIVINVVIDRCIWSKPKPSQRFLRWFPRLISWLEGAYAWLGFLLSFVVVAVVDMVLTDDWRYVDFEERAKVLMGIVFILCAYWFQLRHRFVGEVTDLRSRWAKGEARYQRRFTGKKAQSNPPRAKAQSPKPKPKPVKPPASDLDAELEKLRRKMEGKD